MLYGVLFEFISTPVVSKDLHDHTQHPNKTLTMKDEKIKRTIVTHYHQIDL